MIDILIAERYRPILMHWILYVLIEIIVCRSWVPPPVEMRWELRTPLRCMLTLQRGCFSDSVGARLRLIEQWLNCYRQNSRENSLIKETNLSTLILCLKCLNSTKKIHGPEFLKSVSSIFLNFNDHIRLIWSKICLPWSKPPLFFQQQH